MRGWPSLALLLLLVPRAEPLAVKFAPTGDSRALEAWIAEELKKGEKEVVVAMYHFTSVRLAEALAAARKRGVAVRVLVDAEQAKSERSKDALKKLKDGGIDLRRVTPKGGEGDDRARYHHKFCVIDGRRVFTGSYNWTVSADRENHENLVLITDADTAKVFVKNFEVTWSDSSLSQE